MGYDDKKQKNRLAILSAAGCLMRRRVDPVGKGSTRSDFRKEIARALCSHPGPNDSVQTRQALDCRKHFSDLSSNSLGLAGGAELR